LKQFPIISILIIFRKNNKDMLNLIFLVVNQKTFKYIFTFY